MRFLKMPAVALIVMLFAGPAAALEPQGACQALDAWVSSLDKLPADYDSFMALDSGQRRAVYQKLSDGERAALWQRQLEDRLSSAGLNAKQKELIAETGRLMTPEKFTAIRALSGAEYESVRDTIKGLEARVDAAFPRQQAREIFYHLGPQDSADDRGPALRPICDCSFSENDCASGNNCQPYNCVRLMHDCGFVGNLPCEGWCRPISSADES